MQLGYHRDIRKVGNTLKRLEKCFGCAGSLSTVRSILSQKNFYFNTNMTIIVSDISKKIYNPETT